MDLIDKQEIKEIDKSQIINYLDQLVKKISVIVRPIKSKMRVLGPKHMFLILSLENNAEIKTQITKKSDNMLINFKHMLQYHLQNLPPTHSVIKYIQLNRNVYLREFVEHAESYKQFYPDYTFRKQNCQFFCIQILKQIRIDQEDLKVVEKYRDDNKTETIVKGIFGMAGIFTIGHGIFTIGQRIKKIYIDKSDSSQKDKNKNMQN